jgi:hypothetical protein
MGIAGKGAKAKGKPLPRASCALAGPALQAFEHDFMLCLLHGGKTLINLAHLLERKLDSACMHQVMQRIDHQLLWLQILPRIC